MDLNRSEIHGMLELAETPMALAATDWYSIEAGLQSQSRINPAYH
jgi:hypothetical protein